MKKVQAIIAVLATGITYAVGGIDELFITLVAFIAIDFVCGIIKGISNKNLSSAIAFKGIAKKVFEIVLIVVAVRLDALMGYDQVLRNLVCYFYIADEGISIIENMAEFLPVPQAVKDVLATLKNGDKKEED